MISANRQTSGWGRALLLFPLLMWVTSLSSDLQAQAESQNVLLGEGVWEGEYDLAGIDDVPVSLTLQAGDDGLQSNIEFAESKSYDVVVAVDDTGLVSMTFGSGGDRHQCELRVVGGDRMRGECVSAASDKATMNLTRVVKGDTLPVEPDTGNGGPEPGDGKVSADADADAETEIARP